MTHNEKINKKSKYAVEWIIIYKPQVFSVGGYDVLRQAC